MSHAVAELLRELAEATGLVESWHEALIGTFKAFPLHRPGRVLGDLAVAIADGAAAISHLSVLRDQPALFGPVVSVPASWRVLDRVRPELLGAVRAGRVAARAAAWAAGAAHALGVELCLDFDTAIVNAYSEVFLTVFTNRWLVPPVGATVRS